ncbi:MAG: hypothetical protein ACTHKQ_25850 [Mesorhizobium sp.]
MSGSAFIKGAEHAIGSGSVCIGSTYRRITRGVACIDGTNWVTIANFVPPLSVSVSPSTAYGYASPLKPIPQTVTTSPLTATPTGGKAPFTYSWSITSHTGTSPLLVSPSSASTSARAAVAANTDQVATAHVTVTDALGSTANAGGDFYFSNQSQIG